MQGKSLTGVKKLAAIPKYVSPSQLGLVGFETPFERKLNRENRWVKLTQAIPWDKIVPHYDRLFSSTEGRPPISGRVIIGAMIIKHMESLTDRDTIQHITENVYMQYFLGYSSFTDEAPFTAPLFVAIRKRMTLELTNSISEIIAAHAILKEDIPTDKDDTAANTPINNSEDPARGSDTPASVTDTTLAEKVACPKGKLIMDATVAPQNIHFPYRPETAQCRPPKKPAAY